MANNNKVESKIAGSKSVILTAVLCGIVLVGVIVWAAFTKSANALVNQVAMTVGDKEISGVEMEYQYKDAILQFQTEYKDYASYLGVDFESDLSTQLYTEDMTWKDYFMDSAVKTLTERYLLVNAAEDAGYALPEDEKTAVIGELDSLRSQLSSLGIDFNAYIQSVYGEEISYDLFKNYSLNNAVAYNYLQQVIDSFAIDDATLDSYYAENKDDIDTVDFRFYQFGYTVPTDVAEGDESYKESAKAQADAALAAITDEASFDGAVQAQLSAETELETLSEDVAKANMLPALAEWLFDGSRVSGDKTVIEGNNGFFVLYFCNRELADYETVNVRHILFATEDVDPVYVEGSEDEVDEAATAAAQEAADAEVYAKAESILNEWLAGDKTEESFAKIASDHSADGAMGGLYNQVTKGYMVEEFDAWIFDEARVTGDYGIVKTDYGYHVMYFVGNDEIAWKITARNAVESAEYAEYKADLEEKYEVVTYEEVFDLVG